MANRSQAEIIGLLQQEQGKRQMPPSFSWKRFWLWITSVLAFVVVGGGTLVIALGLEVDIKDQRIYQTGILELSSNIDGLGGNIYLNDELVANRLPVKLSRVRKGDYEVRIERSGYQPWQAEVKVDANQRVRVRGIVLRFAELRPEATHDIAFTDPRFEPASSLDLKITNGNELWNQGQFITRLSMDMQKPSWYVDKRGVVVQAGEDLLYINQDWNHSLVIFTLPSKTSNFFFNQGGRFLIYTNPNDGLVYQVELFEYTSLLLRFFSNAGFTGQ